MKPLDNIQGRNVSPAKFPPPSPPPRQALCNHNHYEYKVFTKDDYKRYVLSNQKAYNITNAFIKQCNERWEHISKGFNFIIGVGLEDNLMFYSVESFNSNVLG